MSAPISRSARPSRIFSSLIDAGVVTVIYRGGSGLATTFLLQLWHQDVTGINDVAQDGDRFGNVIY